ncbi:hypothetical protein SDRG_13451 [Saprolegnia diclina VS20]|uniref:RING-type domain-containing protein n=1 Tax=Saprolegnia diclina (strain VS20) TaxID=1156394 RepID=T0R9E6_SAPDV|nr:hypothetical protein SDRG_13451 [Saprolegnia diclina VS20]EQC28768.1 hypothetical protein SDRG_13451 [Saprolegnia diclina VS20]|eukprot:XP_008617763.1 hypothetical protein SDRG_13451 [Saprolegnia diclina VS20]
MEWIDAERGLLSVALQPCQLCADALVDTRGLCNALCPARVCTSCLAQYIAAACASSDVVANVACPICILPMPLPAWKARLPTDVFAALGAKLGASCASFCPTCSGELPRACVTVATTWSAVLSDRYDALHAECLAFDAGERTAAELLSFLTNVFGPFARKIVPAMYQWMATNHRLYAFVATRQRHRGPTAWYPCCLTIESSTDAAPTTAEVVTPGRWPRALKAWSRQHKRNKLVVVDNEAS